MADPVIAGRDGIRVEVEKGKSYWWCACGRSKNQPYCDGSHQGTEFEPVEYKAVKTMELLFCACKHTKRPPYCDGSHTDIKD